MLASTIQRSVLLAPDSIARIAARYVIEPEERWLLEQSRSVRRSYAEAALRSDEEHAREIWMLRQPDHVRESYVHNVLEAAPDERRRADERT